MVMVMDNQDRFDEQDLDVRRTLAARGAALELVLPEYFPHSPETFADDLEKSPNDPITVDFTDEMTLDEALKVFSAINMGSEDLPRGGE